MIENILDAASLGSLYALMALGIALVFGVMRLVNFAYGELVMLGGYTLFIFRDAPVGVMIAAALVAVCLAALLMERIAFRPVRGADPATLLVTSFALALGVQSLVIIAAGARPKGVNVLPELTVPVEIFGATVAWLKITTVLVTLVLLILFTLFLQRTSLGVQVRAAAEDFRMARLLGVRANRVIAVTFAASGVFAAAVAVLLVAQTGSLTPSMGLLPVLVAFVATVIGGMGSLPGAALGGFMLGALSVALQVVLPADLVPFREALIFTTVILILLVRPQGIMGSRALTERV